jgi:hypothetical protein
LHFGLGDHEKVDSVQVIWPDGSLQTLLNVKADQRLVIDKDATNSGLSNLETAIAPEILYLRTSQIPL